MNKIVTLNDQKLRKYQVELFKSITRSIATHGWAGASGKFTEEQKAWCCGQLIKNMSDDWVKSIFTACGDELTNEDLESSTVDEKLLTDEKI